ncbi:hypothetical protein [Bradyrhizobium sp. NBAIM08]|uniref:hypothetical protein n=1 Tax=Bradyrhizobium sp. NBAIM08 TaxID=2793815 RepID=UPI001CD1C705|nr:hypothetical protein [Bradyrhizobium sp. NBAIM08]MCA1476771.1 hypothetical protein [Bradyrhizobium sp. NBAIM08]
MAEVPDHLDPTDGLTNAKIRFAGLDLWESGEQIIRFEIDDESRHRVGTFSIEVGSRPGATATWSFLRQWLHVIDKMEQFYRRQSSRRGD